ncbi:Glu-tRNA(Gln) amidotransferase subunit GatE [Nitrososphaera sp.]|uniref:Glu-tRNA(Gln) amidotransferase subunit GatE n=1 Tax=Nitrososphaera sp. TaxID=1971748 RepID=UPI0017FE3BC7|nr:Glu-tRNA(Gln) amidotransferase subunit GatE [Nitrososphaera sp.]NWG37030.1 Glu-tRNA(Gln) amidotransferase subunit GatE [Nitrososphaera sp.]
MALPDPKTLDLKVGFEIHQQLGTQSKLFCNCSCKEAEQYDKAFMRRLRPTQSELGAYDPAAMFEFSKMRASEYHAASGTSCLVEADEEPPHEVNGEALDTALVFSLALHSKIMDEIHVMRKIVIDGSNTSGFQRTMLVAMGGHLDVAGKKVGVQSICLEEDASKVLGEGDGTRKYGLDRLGVPLVEIALEPVTGRPEEIMQVALTLGRLLRASKRVARGLGSIRQDVNVSVMGGAVVEVKGVQQLDQLVKVIEHETARQHGLVVISEKLREKGVDENSVGDRIDDATDVVGRSQSKVVKKIMSGPRPVFRAIRVRGFAGMLGFEPYPGIRLGKELGELVRFYDLGGVFHSDELPNYGISQEEVDAVKKKLELKEKDAFVIVGGPEDRVAYATDAIVRRLKAALAGVPAETRAATLDGRTVFSRPRPGAARMYPETDIPTIPVTSEKLESLAASVPRPWDEVVDGIASKYGLNKKLASQIFDSDYLQVFEGIAGSTKVQPTFVASKLTEDVTSLQRQGGDPSLLFDDMIMDVFQRLDAGAIAKESVALIFEKLMKKEAATVDEAIRALGVSSISDDELSAALDKVIADNMAVVREKGMGALSMLMGRSMAVLRGKADGQKINAMLKDKLGKLSK